MATGLFITGTGTDVGKTYVGALIAQALQAAGKRVGVYKPVASGCEECDGRLVVAGCGSLVGSGRSARHVGSSLPADDFARRWHPIWPRGPRAGESIRNCCATASSSGAKRCDVVLVEGAGGLMSPVERRRLQRRPGGRVWLSAPRRVRKRAGHDQRHAADADHREHLLRRARRGRHGAEFAHAASRDDPSTDSNADELARRCVPPLLATVAHDGGFDREVDWWALCKEHRANRSTGHSECHCRRATLRAPCSASLPTRSRSLPRRSAAFRPPWCRWPASSSRSSGRRGRPQ